jgi:hypothetical protein
MVGVQEKKKIQGIMNVTQEKRKAKKSQSVRIKNAAAYFRLKVFCLLNLA